MSGGRGARIAEILSSSSKSTTLLEKSQVHSIPAFPYPKTPDTRIGLLSSAQEPSRPSGGRGMHIAKLFSNSQFSPRRPNVEPLVDLKDNRRRIEREVHTQSACVRHATVSTDDDDPLAASEIEVVEVFKVGSINS